MYMTGFADEAARDIDGQIDATLKLGWENIEARNIDGVNLHDLDEAGFENVCARLDATGVRINCFGSAIANWSKDIRKPFDDSLAEAKRAIPRMKRLGCSLIRIMSFAVIKDRGPEDQMEAERFERLRILTRMFLDEGLQPVHENCMNYGGTGWTFTLRLLENVPGLKLVFDTGNPVFSIDYTRPEPRPMQSAWEFYRHVRDQVAYIHIKDGRWDAENQRNDYRWCGEGDGDVEQICEDLLRRGYDGGISIEPHLAKVFHDPNVNALENVMFDTYVEYGRRMEKILADIRVRIG